VHTPEVAAKRGAKKSAWFKSGNPKAETELNRIRNLKPMSSPKTRARVSSRLKTMNHKPSVRGGNGTGMTEPQSKLLAVLGSNWQAEYSLSLGKRQAGYPTHYKLDLANVALKVCIEVDGHSHRSRKTQDAKKDQKLRSMGWKVLRFWNWDILSWIDSGMPMESSISMTLAEHDIHLSL
ncbi:MAG: endonuclease domain-containing protein, partial [Anaerolineae bacterium]|nr:endonuclease domain-containing protein [Anaerolineae bacterium]